MRQSIKNKLIVKSIIKIIILIFLIYLLLFYQEEPKFYYWRHKKELNKIIDKIDKTKMFQKKPIQLFKVKNITYYESKTIDNYYFSEYVNISMKTKFFTVPPNYIGLVYSYDGEPLAPMGIPKENFIEISNNMWKGYYYHNYVIIERIDKHWFTYKEWYN